MRLGLKRVVPGIKNRDLSRAFHKDVAEITAYIDSAVPLAQGERIRNHFECRPDVNEDQRMFAVSNLNVYFITGEDIFTFPLGCLVGILIKSGWIRLGFRNEHGMPVATATGFVLPGPQEGLALYADLSIAWSERTGKTWPKDEFLNSPDVPEIEIEPIA